MPEEIDLLAKLAIDLNHASNVSVALRLAVDMKAGMTDSLKAAAEEALQNLSSLAERVDDAIGPWLNS